MMYMILWFDYNVMDEVNLVMFYLVSILTPQMIFSLEII